LDRWRVTVLTDLVAVVVLACETQDRAPAEQRALLNVAVRAEIDLNKATSKNLKDRGPDARPSTLVDLVENSYDPSDGRHVQLAAKDRQRIDRQRLRFADDHATAWEGGVHNGAARFG